MLDDSQCPSCDHERHRFGDLPADYTYLLGLYLGDGCISSHRRDVYKLRLTLDAAYPRILEEAAAAMRTVLPRSAVGTTTKGGGVELYSYSRAWPCLLPQHGAGKKHQRRIALTQWQETLIRRAPHLLLRGLIHSDGCRFVNTGKGWRHPRYGFKNYSTDIRRIFRDTCDLLDLHWTVSNTIVYVSRKADVARLDEFVGPKG
jgi:hypothetical protein